MAAIRPDSPTTISGSLNDRQREAIAHAGGPLRILAGAGTGKTQTLTDRFVTVVREQGVPVQQLLAITFSRKAAEEMRSRVLAQLSGGYREPWILTFHAFCFRLLREWWLADGVTTPHLLESHQESDFLARAAARAMESSLSSYRGSTGEERLARDLAMVIRSAKENLIDPVSFARYAEAREQPRLADLAIAYRCYTELLRAEDRRDLADLAFEVVQRLRADERLLAATQARFRHVMIDEFQDTNRAQYELMRLLMPADGNLCVVGDPNQAIYTFRGSRAEYIYRFGQDYPGARTIELVDNYRCPPEVLTVANALSRFDGMEPSVRLVSPPDKAAGEVIAAEMPTLDAEADWIARQIARRIRQADGTLRFAEIAVLARSRWQLDAIGATLAGHGIPVRQDGGGGVDFRVVQDALAAIRLTTAEVRWRDATRLAVLRGADAVALRQIAAVEAEERQIELLRGDAPSDEPAIAIARAVVSELGALAAEPLAVRVYRAIAATGHLSGGRSAADARFLTTLIGQAKEAMGRGDEPEAAVAALLERNDLGLEVPTGSNGGVRLLTVHGAKGLQWPVVFVAGLSEGLLPLAPRAERELDFAELAHWEDPIVFADLRGEQETERAFIAEERRLCYVAVTRASEALYLSSPLASAGETIARSRFIDELGVTERVTRYVLGDDGDPVSEVDLARRIRRQSNDSLALAIDAPEATGGLAAVLLAEWAAQASIRGAIAYHERFLPTPNDPGRGISFSYSGLQTYQDCPRKFLLTSQLRLQADDEDRTYSGIGTITHDILAELNMAWRDSGNPPEDAAVIASIERHWMPDAFSFEAQRVQARMRIEAMVRRYYGWEREQWPRRRPFLIEESIEAKYGPHTLVGRIDVAFERSDGVIEIVDYKTGSSTPALRSSKQLFAYELALIQQKDVTPRVGYIGLRNPADKPRVYQSGFDADAQVKMLDFKEKDREAIRAKIDEAIAGIQANEFPPVPRTCASCPVSWLCPEG